jgi:hypothetical protein
MFSVLQWQDKPTQKMKLISILAIVGVICLIQISQANAQNNGAWEKVWNGGFATTVAYGNGIFVAVNDSKNSTLSFGNAVVSANDSVTNWTMTALSPRMSLSQIIYGGGQFLITDYFTSNNGSLLYFNVLTSTDGINYSNLVNLVNLNSLRYFYAVTYANGLFIVTGSDQNFNTVMLTSTNGIDWTSRDIGTGNYIYAVAYGNGRFVAVGSALLTSPDGITWTYQGKGYGLFSIAFGNGFFVAIDGNGEFVWSTDGINWNLAYYIDGNPHAVAFGNNQFVVAGEGSPGDGGQIFVSLTGTNDWRRSYFGTESAGFYGLTYGNGHFVAVGPAGIVRSQTAFRLICPSLQASRSVKQRCLGAM